MKMIAESLPLEPLVIWLKRIREKSLIINNDAVYSHQTLALLLTAIFENVPLPYIFLLENNSSQSLSYIAVNGEDILSALYDFYYGLEISLASFKKILPQMPDIVSYKHLPEVYSSAFSRCGLTTYKLSFPGKVPNDYIIQTIKELYPNYSYHQNPYIL